MALLTALLPSAAAHAGLPTGLPTAPGPSGGLASPLAAAASGLQAAAADASLILLVGGLSMLALIMALVFLQGLFPMRDRPAGHAPGRHRARQLRPLREAPPLFAERDRSARPGPFRREEYRLPVDRALARVVALQLGEPRLLRAVRGASRVRLYRCRGCADPAGAGDAARAGCAFERQGLQRAFRAHVGAGATVREVRCRARGADACEFEVRH